MVDYETLSTLYYDMSKPVGKSLNNDLEFYKSHIINSKKVLEVGTGTGRLIIPFLQEGINIEGVERSMDMIEMCMKNFIEHKVSTDLIIADVTHYDFEKYDAIIIPSGTMCMFEDIRSVLKNLYDSLSGDGFILFDLVLPQDFMEDESFTYGVRVDDSTELLLHDHRKHIDWVLQKTYQEFVYELVENDVVVDREIQDFTIHWYGIEEMKLLLKDLGYKNIGVFGNYLDTYPNNESHSITLKAYR